MSELAGPAASTPSQALIQDAVFITAGQMELGQIIQQGPRPNDTRAWYHTFLHRRLPQAIESSNAQGVPGPTSRAPTQDTFSPATAQMVLGWSADDDVEPVIPQRIFFRIFSVQHDIRDGIRDRIAASIRNSSGFRIPTHGRVTSPAPSLFPHVKITPWRITNTVVVLGLGIYKATVTYLGQTTAPTTADWIIGVGWTLISYWIGLVEQHDDTATQWFFSHDFSDVVASVFWVFFQLVFGLVVVGGFNVIYIRLYFSIPFAMQQSPLAFLFIFLASMLLTLAIWIVLWFTVLLASETATFFSFGLFQFMNGRLTTRLSVRFPVSLEGTAWELNGRNVAISGIMSLLLLMGQIMLMARNLEGANSTSDVYTGPTSIPLNIILSDLILSSTALESCLLQLVYLIAGHVVTGFFRMAYRRLSA